MLQAPDPLHPFDARQQANGSSFIRLLEGVRAQKEVGPAPVEDFVLAADMAPLQGNGESPGNEIADSHGGGHDLLARCRREH